MSKLFIDANSLLIDSFILAKKIYQSGFRPDFIVGVWRGGTPPGIAIHEFFVYKKCKPSFHSAIKVESYFGIEKRRKATIEGLEIIMSKIKKGDKLLIVDDIFDTGKSAEAVKDTLAKVQFSFQTRIATVYYKPNKNLTKITPDYYLKIVDEWIVFPHELEDLSKEELKQKGFGIFNILEGE
jgi:hypothetical protein